MSKDTNKAKNKASIRRKVRHAEKRNIEDDAPLRDKNIGGACKRGWGTGKALK